MYAPFRLGYNDYLVRDRINDLYQTAREVHASGHSASELPVRDRTRVSWLARWSFARKLIRPAGAVPRQSA